MSRSIKPKIKNLRRFGMLPEGASIRQTSKRFRKKSDQGFRLEEKQKLKFVFGITERQLRRYMALAKKSRKDPAEALLRILETRLDNAVYSLGYARTLSQARQLVGHGHVMVDNRKINIPSYDVKPGEKITLDEKTVVGISARESLEEKKPESLPGWLRRKNNIGEIIRLPEKDELRRDIDMSYVMEFYS